MDGTFPTIHLVFRLMALSQVLLLTIYLLLYERHRIGYIMALTGFSFCCYLVMPWAWCLALPGIYLDVFASSIPALVWLLARWFFIDSKTIPVWFWLVSLAYMAVWLPGLRDSHSLGVTGDLLFGLVPQLIKLGLVAHAILMALVGRSNDLVSQRLKLRVPIAVGAGLLTSIVILFEIWAGGQTVPVIDAVGSLIFFFVSLSANACLFRIRGELTAVFVSRPPAKPTAAVQSDKSDEMAVIEKRVVQQRFYANHGATIGDLADLVGVPEYRLRTMINRGLGYRNFNQFLNHYRIEEASSRLVADPGASILTIALDVGFRSLSSFNKSFRETNGCTPTEYRSRDKAV